VHDADERLPAKLAGEIESVVEGADACDGYRVARKNYFGDRWIRFGGWYPDYSVRLIRRGKGRFNDRAVHEAVQVGGFGAEIAASAAEATGCRVRRLGAPRIPSGYATPLEDESRVSVPQIVAAAHALMAQGRR
jgi:hypothetical protein